MNFVLTVMLLGCVVIIVGAASRRWVAAWKKPKEAEV